MGRHELHHLTIGEMLRVEHPIHAAELETLVQSKAYELTVRGIEQRVFTRGSCWGP